MLNKTIVRGLRGVSAAVLLLGSFGAYAQQGPPRTGEANDPTSPNATPRQAPEPKKDVTGTSNPNMSPPKVGEANDPTSPNYQHPPAKDKPMKQRAPKTKPPVTGEANDQTSDAGTTEAAKAAKAAKGKPPTE
jgi:hypothetical protein